MKIKKFNISKPRNFSDSEGNEKTVWFNIGVYTDFHKDDGQVNRIIQIPAIDLKANIFEQKKKDEKAAEDKPEVEADEVSADEVPF